MRAARSVLVVCTFLFGCGMLAGLLSPLANVIAAQRLIAVAPAADQPSPKPRTPPEEPETPPEEPTNTLPERLPDLAEGAPSLMVRNGDRSCRAMALTYDAGSGADGAAAVLDVLEKHQVRSTFFLTGRWVERYPDLAQRIVSEGHEIGNHTYSHPDLTQVSPEEALADIQDGEAAIARITGIIPRPLFREPYGAYSDEARLLVRQAGYSYSILWDVDTIDWQFPPAETIVDRILSKGQNGSIVLSHLNVPQTAGASDTVIPLLREQGFHLVTITELLQCKNEAPGDQG